MQFCSSYAGLNQHLVYSTRGWHRMLWESGIPVDFVNVTEIGAGSAKPYKALVLPFPMSLSEEVAGRLEAYVRDGGNLVSEASPGRVDENGLSTRGEMSPKLRELFGVRQRSLTMVREPEDSARWMPAERTWGEYLDPATLEGTGSMKGQKVTANYYLQTFEAKGGQAILDYNGAAAGVTRKAGKGTAWLLGTYIGHNGTAYRNEQTLQFVRELMKQCGVRRQNQGELLVQKRIGAEREAWILTNPTDHDVTEMITVPKGAKVTDLLAGAVSMTGDQVRVAVKSLDVQVLIIGK
jgi:beta-galactosidase GanA